MRFRGASLPLVLKGRLVISGIAVVQIGSAPLRNQQQAVTELDRPTIERAVGADRAPSLALEQPEHTRRRSFSTGKL